MKSRTYEGWKLLGYHVIKGERATGRDKEGTCTFTLEQVEEDRGYLSEDCDATDADIY